MCTNAPSPCGTLCTGVCDPTCGTCVAPDFCPVSNTCAYEWIIQGTGCIKTYANNVCTQRPGYCEMASCNVTSGQCVYQETCSVLSNSCWNYTCISSSCIKTFALPGANACNSPACSDGIPSLSPTTCGTDDSCYTWSCDSSMGCIATETTNTQKGTCSFQPNACYKQSCSSGLCSWSLNCDDGNNCTTDSCQNGTCQNVAVVCTAPDACSSATCNPDTGLCESSQISCDDGISCTEDSCDISSGCLHVPLDSACGDGDGCSNLTCVVGVGCVASPIYCTNSTFCLTQQCIPYSGCTEVSRVCQPSGGGCSTSICDEQSNQCNDKQQACADITAALIGAGLSTGTLAAIAVAASIVGCCFMAGGAYAVTHRSSNAHDTGVSTNPLYQTAPQNHDNPLHNV